MSSATPWKVDEVSRDIRGGGLVVHEGGPTHPLSYRQKLLDWLWRYFRCSQYEGRKYDWDGRENVPAIDRDVIAHTGVIPPGFYDAGGSLVPLKFREPSATYNLVRVIVKRFTSLLFGQQRHPKIDSDDPDTADWLTGFAEATRLWAAMIEARDMGGAMGTVAMGYKFVDGKPFVEVHDPRWCEPTFSSRVLKKVVKLEILYEYPDMIRDEEGQLVEKWFWYRRVIDTVQDEIWPRVPADADSFPIWERERSEVVKHDFGFCPIVWIQNQPVKDDIDGDSDCHGVHDLCERVDGLWSQADRGTLANCDPTVTISSNSEFDEIHKGSGNALHLEQGGQAGYLEMTGSGIDRAIQLAEKLEERVLTVARCVLDRNEGGPSRTATEIEHNYSSMIEQADILREQYGEKGVKVLLEMVLRSVRKMSGVKIDKSDPNRPQLVKNIITLPKRKILDPENGKLLGWKERQIGVGNQIELNWPKYFEPSLEVVSKAVDAAGRAKDFRLVDQDHATGFVSEYFHVENKGDMIRKMEAESKSSSLAPDMSDLSWGGKR